jgi:hypothetical protein
MLGTLRSFLLIGLGIPLALAGLAGCGAETRRAETETESTTTSVPSLPAPSGPAKSVPIARVTDPHRLAYIDRTDRICGRFDPERSTARKRVGESADIQGAVKAYEVDTALGSSELRQIMAVPPPPGDAALLRANVFEPIRRQLVLRAKIRAALAAVDVPRLRALRAELDSLSQALTAFARGYGWRSCGEG